METVEQRHRNAAADLLHEISSLLDHNGIGQVADLIRDGEYDEHEATQTFARFEASLPPSGIAEMWQPQIGEPVQVTEEVDNWREWQRTPLFVAGITAERGKEGLNVSVCEEWPLNTRSSGFTDDFWINRPFKRDMLRPDRSLDLSNKGVG